MSIQSCFSRTAENCDSPCVLEYRTDTEDGLPTCVPPSSSLHGLNLSDDDVTIIKQILERLLPETDSADFRKHIQHVHHALGEFVNRKIMNAVRDPRFTSWKDAANKIATEVIMEIEAADCPICYAPLNDIASDETIYTTQCCSNVLHLRCYTIWAESSGECVTCRERVNAVQGVPVVLNEAGRERENINAELVDVLNAERKPVLIYFCVLSLLIVYLVGFVTGKGPTIQEDMEVFRILGEVLFRRIRRA